MKSIWSFSNLASAIIILMAVVTISNDRKWTTEQGFTFNDAAGYYAFLPATFIHDFDLEEFQDKIGVKQNPENGKLFYQVHFWDSYLLFTGLFGGT